MSSESESITTCGNNKFKLINLINKFNFFKLFLEFSKAFQPQVSKHRHTASTCSKKSSMFYFFQRVIRNRYKMDFFRAFAKVLSLPRPSPKIQAIFIELNLQHFTNGLTTLVKTKGAVDKPNGRTETQRTS